MGSFMERKVLGAVEYFHDVTVTHTDKQYMTKHNTVDDRAVYFIKSHPKHPEFVEMSFDLTAYQPTLKDHLKNGGDRIYQTIFLNSKQNNLWSIDEISASKTIDS